jgi:hypothetical protein
MKIIVEKELSKIVEDSEEPLLSLSKLRARIAYTRREKKAFAILALNLSDS